MPTPTPIRLATRPVPAVKTLLDTAFADDAELTGRDWPQTPCEGGLRIVWDAKGPDPTVTLSGPEGEVLLIGAAEIQATLDALLFAASWAMRPAGSAM